MRLALAALAIALPLAAQAAPPPEELLTLPEPAGVARLLRADLPAPGHPLVIILPDALGEDGRSEPYVDALLGRGIASLLLGLSEVADLPGPESPRHGAASLARALEWAGAGGPTHARIALLGFGAGARAALAAAQGLPVVALYPRCPGLPIANGPALVIQGALDSEGCGPEVTRLAGADHAWDATGALWPVSGPLLPDPAAPELRRRARPDGEATRQAAEATAQWLAAQLGVSGASPLAQAAGAREAGR